MKIKGSISLDNATQSSIISGTTSGQLIFTPGGTGYIGIGQSNPNAQLHIKQTNSTIGQGQLMLDALNFGSQYEATIMFAHAGNVRGIFGFENAVGKMHLKRSEGSKTFSATTNNAAMTGTLMVMMTIELALIMSLPLQYLM